MITEKCCLRISLSRSLLHWNLNAYFPRLFSPLLFVCDFWPALEQDSDLLRNIWIFYYPRSYLVNSVQNPLYKLSILSHHNPIYVKYCPFRKKIDCLLLISQRCGVSISSSFSSTIVSLFVALSHALSLKMFIMAFIKVKRFSIYA